MWEWLASAVAKSEYAAELRLDLLKSTYRLSPESHPQAYAQAEIGKAALGLDIPITIYQSQQDRGLNASLSYLPGEGHIIFSGQLLQLLKEDELLFVLAHELAHYHLRERDGGAYDIMDRLVHTLANSPRSSPSHLHTARLAQLYTEIYCDRGSWLATREVAPMIRGLVKLQTGLADVHAESYLRQAQEVLRQKPGGSEETTHPEAYIRAHALSLWTQDPTASEIAITAMIEGDRSIDELDLLGQVRLADLTRIMINDLLQPSWFRSDPVFAHARLFFEDFAVGAPSTLAQVPGRLPPQTKDYLGYVLLDFAVMDPELEDEPLKQAIRISERWDFADSFAALAQKELKLKKREWEKLAAVKQP